ncbi:serine/threonine-protein kinase [Myxococcota bacterium]|nr:serine/threonine-protein kinase [Myxococcota bacterium]
MTVNDSPRPGTVLAGRFRVRNALGRGAFGAVYACDDLLRGDLAAVKLLHRAEGRPLGRFYLEYRALRRLNHPNVVAARAFARHGSKPLIAMDLAQGLPLHLALAPLPAPPGAVLPILGQLLEALATVHGRGLVHRDLKPQNLLVSSEGHLSILDFGAVRLDEPDEMGMVPDDAAVGTAAYVAPEVLRGTAPDGRADLYSVGVVVYELLTGVQPFPPAAPGTLGPRWPEPRRACRLDAVRPDLHPALVDVVDCLLAFDAVDRPRGALEVLEVLRSAGLLDGAAPPAVAGSGRAGSPGEDIPLLGREEAWEALGRAAEAVEDGRSAVLRVGGGPGCGASRFLREAGAWLRGRGWAVFPARPEALLVPGAAGWAGLTAELLRTTSARAEEYGPLVARLGGEPDPRREELGAEAGGEYRADRRAGLSGWARLLLDSAAGGPVALLLEHVDRLERPWRELAEHASAAVVDSGSKVLVLRAGPHPDVELRRLTLQEVEDVFPERGQLGVDDVRAARLLHERSRGVPAQVASTLDEWARAGLVHAVPGGYAVSRRGRESKAAWAEGGWRAGQEAAERWAPVVGALAGGARRVLGTVSMADFPLSLAALARACSLDEWSLMGALEDLVEAGVLLYDARGGRFQPVHPVVGPLARRDWTGADAARAHERVADALRGEGAPDETVAQHLVRAGGDEEAARALARAAERALADHDPTGALEYGRRAMELSRDGKLRWEASRAVCRGARRCGELGQTGEAEGVLLRPPDGLSAAARVDAVLLVTSLALDRGEVGRAEDLIRDAALLALEDPAARGAVHLRRVQMFARSGRLKEAAEHAEAALDAYGGIGDRRGVAKALQVAASVQYRRGEYDRAVELARRAVQSWNEPEESAHAAHSWHLLGIALADRGEIMQALAALEAARERFLGAGDLQALAYNRSAALTLACRTGRPPFALAQDVLRYASRLQIPELEASAHLALARAGGLEGTPTSAARSAERAADLYEALGNRKLTALAYARLALASAQMGRPRAADHASRRALELVRTAEAADIEWQVEWVRSRCAADPEERGRAAAAARSGAATQLAREGSRGVGGALPVEERMREICRLRDGLGEG